MLNLSSDVLMYRVMMLIPLLLSLTVHEWAHAWSAYRLGDDTAAMQGRLTLDPLAHMDPLGTFLLPLLGIPFGWAKPVPVNPARFRRGVSMRTGMALTAAAGPLSNLVLAMLGAVTLGLMWRFNPAFMMANESIARLISVVIPMNLGLALFNLFPVPPLDGSRIVDGFLPYRFQGAWERITQYSPLLLLGVIVAGGYLLAGPMGVMMDMVNSVIRTIARA